MKKTLLSTVLLIAANLGFTQHIATSATPASGDIYHESGKLGIGTSLPIEDLHVEGTDILLKNASGLGIHFRADTNNSFINNMDNFVDNGSIGNGSLIITGQKHLLFRTGNIGSSGTQRMIIHENGNIGIGTDTPDRPLDIKGSLKIKSNAPIIEFYEEDNAQNWFLVGDGNYFDIRKGSLSSGAFRIDDLGRVGIGSSSPSEKLEIKDGRLKINSSASILHLRESDNAKDWFLVADGNTFSIRENDTGTQRFSILNGGNVGIGTAYPREKLHIEGDDILLKNAASTTSLHFRTDGSNSFISNKNGFMGNGSTANGNLAIIGQKDLTFHTGTAAGNLGPLKMIIKESGHVGIGTASPKEKLHVEGNDILLKNTGQTSVHIHTNGTNSYINNMDNFVDNGSTGNESLIITGQKQLLFRTGNAGSSGTQRMIVDESGNVGIGTDSPDTKLQVDGNVSFLSGARRLLWSSSSTRATTLKSFLMPRNTDNSNWDFGQGFGYHHYYRAWYFDGKVGIGTQDPKAKLHVSGGTVGEPILLLDNTFAAYSNKPEDNRPLTLRRGIRDVESMNIYVQDTETFFTYKNDEAFNTVRFRMVNTDTESGGGANANASNVMSIVGNTNGGGVGIGTDNPGDWRLAVNGNIRAKEIVVETGWSDFVFESDYKLPTLEEVEQHIKTKGHLKDIPNAKEVEENGIQLGEMNAKLLQKIEELTLYLIEEHKQNKIQQTEIEALKAINIKLLEKLEGK